MVRNQHRRLFFVEEGAVEADGAHVTQPEFVLKEPEVSADGNGRRGKDPGRAREVQPASELVREGRGCHPQHEAALTHLEPLDLTGNLDRFAEGGEAVGQTQHPFATSREIE